MELEELKNQWNLLSEQLKKNEIINHEAIKRMIEKRTLSARDRLIGANVIAVFVLTGMLFLFPLSASSYPSNYQTRTSLDVLHRVSTPHSIFTMEHTCIV